MILNIMNELGEKKVGGIVAENFRTAKVFTDYGIDFCCKGGVKLRDACEKKGVNLDKITAELAQVVKQQDETHYQDFGMTDLVDHIVNVHHKYVETTIPSLKFYVEKKSRKFTEKITRSSWRSGTSFSIPLMR